MARETKSRLTRADIKKDLLGEMRAGVISMVALILVFLLVGLILTFIACRPGVGRVICGGLFAALIGYLTVAYTKSYVMIARDRFVVVEDELLRYAEETVRRHRTWAVERVFYFAEQGRYVVSEIDGSAFDYSNEGDKFYLVICGSKKNGAVLRVYNARVYEWRG